MNGVDQAHICAHKIEEFYSGLGDDRDNRKILMYFSPFLRAKQTADIIWQDVGSRLFCARRMNLFLGEQDFGE